MTRTAVTGVATVLALLLVSAGCQDTDGQQWTPADAGVKLDGAGGFLDECENSSQCIVGECIAIGSVKRCSTTCKENSDCPQLTGWTCDESKVCRCVPGTKTNGCKADGDCDGIDDNPPTTEVCNDIDDDCNGAIDDVGASAEGATFYYRDQDGDSYGDVDQGKWACKKLDGWVENSQDCNDQRPQDNPGVIEICGDAYDNDCDGKQEDVDVCGLTPIQVTDVSDPLQPSATLKSCGADAAIDDTVDLTEVLAKQDGTHIKFTLRLAGGPASSTCSTYKIAFGDPAKTGDDLVYIFRLAPVPCNTLPAQEVYYQGNKLTSTMVTGFNASSPGHVSFTIDKNELFARVPDPTYRLRACTNETASASTDLTACATDTCETRVHRD